jgi:hypothetical protein
MGYDAFEPKEEVLTAHFYCWEPTLDINPKRSDFQQRLREAQDQSGTSSKLLEFVATLRAKYPDLTDTEGTPWATGPLAGEITGNFINFAVSWSWYNDALIAFIVEAAHSHGLHCFDPQSGRFYESARGR